MREEIEILKEKIINQWGWEGDGAVAQWVQAESQLREDDRRMLHESTIHPCSPEFSCARQQMYAWILQGL
jgi:hypothetical protein